MEGFDGIWPERDARADLAQLAGSLHHENVEASGA
jgi:hypothetical protein